MGNSSKRENIFNRENKTVKTKSISSFVREHRDNLDNAIIAALTKYDKPGLQRNIRLNDKDRKAWILNDEGLYRWAQSEDVKI